MANVDSLADQIRKLLPLEEEHVDAFDELVGQLAEAGETPAARELLLLLDDNCELGGVMEGVTAALQSLQPSDVAGALAENLDDVLGKGRRHAGSILRWLVSSDVGRQSLKVAGRELAPESKERLRDELRHVGRFPKYADGCREVEAAL